MIVSRGIQELEEDIGRAYTTLDSAMDNQRFVMADAIMKRIEKLEKERSGKIDVARELFGDSHDLANANYDSVYIEGIIVEIRDYAATNPTTDIRVNPHQHLITLDIGPREMTIYLDHWENEPISPIFDLGERMGFYCYIIPDRNGFPHYFTA